MRTDSFPSPASSSTGGRPPESPATTAPGYTKWIAKWSTKWSTKWCLTHPGLTAGIMVVATGAATLRREAIAAALLSGIVVGFGLSGSV